MWKFGTMSKSEAKSLKQAGRDIIEVDELSFNKMINPKSKSPRDIDKGDVLVGIFTEEDLFEDQVECINYEKAHKKMKQSEIITESRYRTADNLFGTASKKLLNIQDDCEVVEHDGWDYDGNNTLVKRFYYNYSDDSLQAASDSMVGSFIVEFHSDSDRVAGVHSST